MLQCVYKAEKEGCLYSTMVALSIAGGGNDCVTLCVYRRGRCVAVAQHGDALWVRVEVGWEYMEPSEYDRGSFYMACYDGTVLRVSIPLSALVIHGSVSSSLGRMG
uniref:Uncharacterized protein n=1 Tax=Leersia perrieri TaxID=77586 RepID=A0A0D9XD24_9ORYZ